MSNPINPFYSGIDIPDEYFCDRVKETEEIINLIDNGFNIVLKSPRRIGKSSLIKHIFNQESIKNKYNTLFIDIYGTNNLDEFTGEFRKAFWEAPFARTERDKKSILSFLKGGYLQMNLSPSGEFKSLRFGFSPSENTEMTLDAMFRFMEQTESPNIIAIDEFQTINEYPEKAAAILRSFVQQMNNTHFIFAGSSRHMLNRMFEYPSEPFYRSSTSMDLKVIPLESYTDFCTGMFAKYGKSINTEAVHLVYYLFQGNTFDMQSVMKFTFSSVSENGSAVCETVIGSVEGILNRRDQEFRETMSRLRNKKERNLVFCIASEGIAYGLTSSAMIKKYDLDSASSVQNAIKNLSREDFNLVQKMDKGTYILRDRFFELWLSKMNTSFDDKIAEAKERFFTQKAMSESLELPKKSQSRT